jgi:anti-anti-sigma factor
MAFTTESAVFQGLPVLRLHGEFDSVVCGEVEAGLLAEADSPVGALIVDMLDVPYMESRPLAMLTKVDGLLSRRGMRMAIVCSQDDLRRIFHIAGLDRKLTICADLLTAAGLLAPPDGVANQG